MTAGFNRERTKEDARQKEKKPENSLKIRKK